MSSALDVYENRLGNGGENTEKSTLAGGITSSM
jgi:hypothetical protein